jgi:F-type H+-transporting ATPase subunit b
MILAAVSSESAITVDFNATTLIVVVLFVGFTLVIKPLLLDPMLRLFEEREKRIDGEKARARAIDEKSATALRDYEKAMAAARATANAEREKLRGEAAKKEQEILARARAESAEALENGKRAVMAEAVRARADLKADATKVASELAARVLGRGVQS